MSKYSIKDLEKLTGIKAHTIRIWESRYKILEPERTETNIRYYNDKQLKLIMNISVLNSNGFKISHIAKMNEEEISNAVMNLSLQSKGPEVCIDQLVMAMTELNEIQFDKIINSYSLKSSFEKTITDLIYPFLDKVGVLWQTGIITPLHEHFISNLIRQKLIVAIEGVSPEMHPDPKTFFLFLPEGEFHEFSLLFYYYLVKKRGHRVFYLGQSTPIDDLVLIAENIKPDFLITSFITYLTDQSINQYLKMLTSQFPDTQILISGRLICEMKTNPFPKLKCINSIRDLYNFL